MILGVKQIFFEAVTAYKQFFIIQGNIEKNRGLLKWWRYRTPSIYGPIYLLVSGYIFKLFFIIAVF